MKKLVIYDSQYGNTKKIAEAVANAIKGDLVGVEELSEELVEGASLLVVGSPTQGGRPTQRLQDFFFTLPGDSLKGVSIASFDTRLKESNLNFALKLLVKTIGYAASKMETLLVSKGGRVVNTAEGFFVKGKEGPLMDGELERAIKWAKKIKI